MKRIYNKSRFIKLNSFEFEESIVALITCFACFLTKNPSSLFNNLLYF